jgi:hypothetical protein
VCGMSGDKKVVLIEADGDRSREMVEMTIAAYQSKGLEASIALFHPQAIADGIDMYSISKHEPSVSVRDLKVARLKMLGIDKDVSDLTDEQLDVFLKVCEGYKTGERCKCGARAEYYTNDGFVCFEHSGMTTSSASPKPVKIPEIFGPPKNRAERRKNKEKTWKRK